MQPLLEPIWPRPSEGCDCHIHIYDLNTHPLQQTSPVSPPHANWSDYLKLRAELGLARCIIVQPMGYGFDNSCTLQALKMAKGSARAVISMPKNASDSELAELAVAGVVGIRFQMVPNSGNIMTWEELEPIANRVAELGWTINLQLDGRTLPLFEQRLLNLPCKLVIDHVGKFLEPVSTEDPAFRSLEHLVQTGNVWVKLSAMYETSRCPPPTYDDVGALARALVHKYPDRCLWASNWPHPTQRTRPNDLGLLSLLDYWCPTKEARDKILVDNPATLYGF